MGWCTGRRWVAVGEGVPPLSPPHQPRRCKPRTPPNSNTNPTLPWPPEQHGNSSATSKNRHHNSLLTPNFELKFFVCRHVSMGMRIPKSCAVSVRLSVCMYPENINHTSFVNISPIASSNSNNNGKVFTSTTAWKVQLETQKFDFLYTEGQNRILTCAAFFFQQCLLL